MVFPMKLVRGQSPPRLSLSRPDFSSELRVATSRSSVIPKSIDTSAYRSSPRGCHPLGTHQRDPRDKICTGLRGWRTISSRRWGWGVAIDLGLDLRDLFAGLGARRPAHLQVLERKPSLCPEGEVAPVGIQFPGKGYSRLIRILPLGDGGGGRRPLARSLGIIADLPDHVSKRIRPELLHERDGGLGSIRHVRHRPFADRPNSGVVKNSPSVHGPQ